MKTPIEWTDHVWNPTRGCSRVSPGCEHCYAELIAARFSGPGKPFELFADKNKSGSKWTGLVQLQHSKLFDPLSWRRPRRVFVNSMSDLFHEGLADSDIDLVFAVMALTPHNSYQILTKRARRMREYLGYPHRFACISLAAGIIAYTLGLKRVHRPQIWPLPNVWLGVSVEDKARAARLVELLATPAAVRFVSYEPALEWVDFTAVEDGEATLSALTGWRDYPAERRHEIPREFRGLDWGIIGGESGPAARPFDVKWALDTIEAFRAAGVPLFVKQLGARAYDSRPHGLGSWEIAGTRRFLNLQDPKGGDWDEWPADVPRLRQFPAAGIVSVR